jgi:hypothetical protein
MLLRIFSLTILLAGLLFAGVPAFACEECPSTNECCPNGPLARGSDHGSTVAPSDFIQQCCTASAAGSAALAADVSSNDFNKHLKRFELPVVSTSPAILPARVASSRWAAISATPSFTPSHALLYLSTGRLRL